jgi:hypothetical protein
MINLPTKLVANQGSTKSWRIVVANGIDELENVSTVVEATFVVKESSDATASIAEFTVQAGTLTVDTSNPSQTEFVCTLSQTVADALTTGTHIGQFGARFGATDWRFADLCYVEVIGQVGTRDPA